MLNRVLPGALVVLVGWPTLASTQTPGNEFLVNAYTTSLQFDPSVAADAHGGFVVAWISYDQDGSERGVFARRYDADGVAGPEIQVNSYTTGYQFLPAIAADASGNFVVAWTGGNHQDGSTLGVFGQRFNASGAPQGPNFQINSYTSSLQLYPAVAFDAQGNFVVVWSGATDYATSGRDVFGQRYDASGVPLGGEFRVNSYTPFGQSDPAIATAGDGSFVVVWTSDAQSSLPPYGGQDGSNSGVFGQRFDSAGTPVGGEFQVHSYTTDSQARPAVASEPGGDFVAVWINRRPGPAGTEDVFGQRFDAAGARRGDEFAVASFQAGSQPRPAVAMDVGGAFVVLWDAYEQDGSLNAIAGRRYDAEGAPQGDVFQVNSYTNSQQARVSIASHAAGEFVAVWNSPQDGSGYAVMGTWLRPDPIFKDDFESGGLSAWTAAATDDGDLSVSAAAALHSTGQGMQGLIDDTAALYVEDASPRAEGPYRARFHFEPRGFDPGEAEGHFRVRLFSTFATDPARRLATIVLRRRGGTYSLMGRARLDDNRHVNTGFLPIAHGPHAVELRWDRSTGPDANSGALQLWIDGTSVVTLSGLDNSRDPIGMVRLGALSVKPGASGTLYWDEFESRRASDIGP